MKPTSLSPRRAGTSCILAVLVTWGCASVPPPPVASVTSEESRIIRVLDDVERGIEEHDVAAVLRHVSVFYHDAEGTDYSKLRTFLSTMFGDYGTIEVERTPMIVSVQNTRAQVRERFVTRATPRPGTGASPIDQAGYVVVRLERVAGDWLITEWAAAAEQ